MTDPLLEARARVIHDLGACGCDAAQFVDVVDAAVAGRRWWLDEWPAGEPFVAGLVAQDVQETLLESAGRWPACPLHGDHELLIEPELGPDPHWVCERAGTVVCPLGALGRPG